MQLQPQIRRDEDRGNSDVGIACQKSELGTFEGFQRQIGIVTGRVNLRDANAGPGLLTGVKGSFFGATEHGQRGDGLVQSQQ